MNSRIKFFLKKLKLKKDVLETLEIKSGFYDAAMRQISYETIPEDIYAKDSNENKVISFTKSVDYILHIKLKKLLNSLGVEFDDCVKLDIDQK